MSVVSANLAHPVTDTTESQDDEQVILCPFLRMIKPRTDNMFAFMADLAKGGVSWECAILFTIAVTT